MSEWFERWFGEEYLDLYPHRDDAEASRAVALIDRLVPLAGRRVLDLACGSGRHIRAFAERGALVVGLDLSMPLLTRARRGAPARVHFTRADMRLLPFAPASFDLTVNLFTSFGYFADDAEHHSVLREIATALAPGGSVVLDYFNADRVRATLVPHEEQVIGARRVAITRRISDDDRFVLKEMHLIDDDRRFLERVRLLDAATLEEMLERAGLVVRHRFGDYDGTPAGPAMPRVMLIADRP